MAWSRRPRGCRPPRYCEDDKFTIRMNHGGSICDNLYVNGTVDFIDFCDKDQMSMFEIGLMVKELGYDGIVLYHYELPNSSSVEKLLSDADVMKMCECVPRVREIDIYLTQLADDPYTFLNKHKEIELQRVEGSGVQKQRSLVIEDLGYADCSPVVLYNRKSNVEQATTYPKPHKVKIVEQEAVNNVGDFSEPEAPKKGKGKTVAALEAPKKGKGKRVAATEAPKRGMATRSSKGKAMAAPTVSTRGKGRKSSKDKGEDSDASSFVDSDYGGITLRRWLRNTNRAPVEDTFRPLEDEERNEGEGGGVNEGEGGVRNSDNLVGGDQPSQTGQSGDQPSQTGQSGDHRSQTAQNEDHPSHTGQNENHPSQTGQNREPPSLTRQFEYTDLQDTRLEEGDQAVEDELKSVHSDEDDERDARRKKFKHYNHETDKENPIFDTGMIFSDAKVFREAVREYCLLSGKEVSFTRNERYKLKAVCKAVSCPWQIYVASKNPTDRSLVMESRRFCYDSRVRNRPKYRAKRSKNGRLHSQLLSIDIIGQEVPKKPRAIEDGKRQSMKAEPKVRYAHRDVSTKSIEAQEMGRLKRLFLNRHLQTCDQNLNGEHLKYM
ncbi:hypothetical protein ACE6H2_006083 [Prunus campanulata]